MRIGAGIGIDYHQLATGNGARPSPPPTIKPLVKYSAKGKTNSDPDRNVLKNLVNTGQDMYLRNFAYSGMSGYGGYMENFLNWETNLDMFLDPYYNLTESHFSCRIFLTPNDLNIVTLRKSGSNVKSFKARIEGVSDACYIEYVYYNNGVTMSMDILADGVYTFPESTTENSTELRVHNKNGHVIEITIEQIPLYPDALVFDGLDDYLEWVSDYTAPLTDYTVIVKRDLIEGSTFGEGAVAYCFTMWGGEYIFEIDHYYEASSGWEENYSNSYGYTTDTTDVHKKSGVAFQNKHSYNGKPISAGEPTIDGTVLYIGRSGSITGGRAKMALYDFILYDRSLTEEEIQKEIIKYNL